MDDVKARELEAKLVGQHIGNSKILSLRKNGKSAAVFRAEGPKGQVAVKIFDDDLITRYGDATQFARIERELQLVGKHHPNLIKILDGGIDKTTGNHFIVMEYCDGPNIKECLHEIPPDIVPSLVKQLADAAKFLEGEGLVHRDIKPENIVLLDNYRHLVLLDLGVVRPISGSTLTDANGIQAFIGTLQYSSPEFLLRKEVDSPEGWRAITFYQIGAVLHDLIMRRPLFAEYETPYSRMVNAVQNVTPEIQSSTCPPHLVDLARFCLIKDWEKRIKLVKWDSFTAPDRDESKLSHLKERVTNRTSYASAELPPKTEGTAQTDQRNLLIDTTRIIMNAARSIRSENSLLPPIKIERRPERQTISVRMDGSASIAIKNTIRLVFHTTAEDVGARIVTVTACGCLGDECDFDICHQHSVIIFQGKFDGSLLTSAVETALYDVIDQAQTAGLSNQDIVWITPNRNHYGNNLVDTTEST